MQKFIIPSLFFGLAACGSDGSGGEACQTTSDCAGNAVCLSERGSSACAPICTASANECSATASCGSVGALSASVCQEPAPANPAEETPQEQPRIPCATDAECQVLDSRGVCAEFQGRRDCTIACSVETDCDVPSLGGPKLDFMTCIADEGNAARTACLPDAACFDNPLSCISGLPGGLGGGLGG